MKRHLFPAILIMVGLAALGAAFLVYERSDAHESTGIVAQITAVSIRDDEIPVVTFTLADDQGNPLSLGDISAPRFLIARLVVDETTGQTHYENYFLNEVAGAEYTFEGEVRQPALVSATQPTFESGKGEFGEVSPGEYSYTFGQALGENYDPAATHLVGAQIVRESGVAVANPVYTFVPNGSEPTVTRLISTAATCNSCHREIGAHGGNRNDFELCILCHTPQNVDPETGNTPDMKVMVHKIHDGANLPTVQAGNPYYIVGFRQSIHDYSDVVWPQDVRNCTTCHTGPDGDHYKTAPNAAACTACHDDVNLETGENHPAGPQPDSACSMCHQPEGQEFDLSITGAHTIPRKSAQLKGVNLEIINVENAVPGGSPLVTFKVTDDSGAVIAPGDMDYLAVTLAGPTSDYVNRVTETVYRSSGESPPPPAAEDLGDGTYRFTFTYSIPEDATGTYAVGLEGYVMEAIEGVEDPVRDAGFNPVTYVALDGGEPTPRRMLVDREKCNVCHNDLALHGTIRQNTEYCVLCHNPMATDEERRPPEAMPPTSINFRVMIHRIHRGEEANNPLVVYGFGGNPVDFSDVAFPGKLNDCQTCHVEGAYDLPLPSGVLPTTITQAGEVVSVTPAIQSVCSACHDSTPAIAHMMLQTTSDSVETCAVCHGAGRDFDVVKVHSQP
jgi:OmcA/MtrC family decaheme c-type cytochrome